MSNRSVNFYRTDFFNRKNRKLVEFCKRGDKIAILKHIFEQDLNHPSKWEDELFENRYGMQVIYEAINSTGKKLAICDVACGNGTLLKKLKSQGHIVAGIDISPVRVLLNRKNIGTMILAFVEDIPLPSESFDCVIVQECLEHVMDLDKSLREIWRILKKGGTVFCQVPDGNFADGVNHIRLFNKESLKQTFSVVGFKVISVGLIPYLVGEGPYNIFLKAIKNELKSKIT